MGPSKNWGKSLGTKASPDQRPRLTSNFYRAVGNRGWRKSAYSTDTWKYPVLREWLTSQLTKKTRRILSIGCGTGELEKSLRELRYRVIGLDFSFEMLRSAARNGRDALVQADGNFLPFASDSFDALILPESLGHLKADQAFPEALRVLKKHGRLLITTYPEHRDVHPLYTKSSMDGLCGQLSRAGFRIKEQRLLRPRRTSVEEVSLENRSALLYVLAVKQSSGEKTASTPARGAA
jgi:SAM-dependent methyltransferase